MPDYDRIMLRRSAEMLVRLHEDVAYRHEIMRDVRGVHRELFAGFAPAAHPEYAGTYRGTANSSLEFRISGAPCILAPEETFAFVSPAEVHERMAKLMSQLELELPAFKLEGHYEKLMALTHFFCWFGTIHPFLDGNGHVQRALFAAMAVELDLSLTGRFAIHPRSFDRLLAYPLEMFTRSGGGQDYLAMVAEYLAFWLGGPFDAPGQGIFQE